MNGLFFGREEGKMVIILAFYNSIVVCLGS
jgi:hypothetical protein